MSNTALITGIAGQDGAYLSQFLLKKGYGVTGMVRDRSKTDFWRLEELDILNNVEIVEGNLCDGESLASIIQNIKPTEIYNLAAQSFVGASWDKSVHTAEVNAMGVLHLLNAIKANAPETKFYQASTSEMYGRSAVDVFQNDSVQLHPRSPYAVSKLFAHCMTVNYRESYDLFACAGILFNHESPLRSTHFVTRKISDGVARIALGMEETISLGTLNSERDWGFAGDYVRAMWMMLQQEIPDDFIVSTGKRHSIRDFLDLAFKEVGIEDWSKHIVQDPAFMRPNELDILTGKNDRAREVLGWEPEVGFEELVSMMVQRDLERLSPSS